MVNRDAVDVIAQLRKFRDDIDTLSARVEGKRSITRDEKTDLQNELRTLKAALKSAAKRSARNSMESAFLLPALTRAAAHFRLAVNSDPFNANWGGELYKIRLDITYYLSQLEEKFPKL